MKRLRIKELALVGVLGAAAYVLLLARFPLPFMPPFMDFDLSGIPEILGIITIGPLGGIWVALVKILVKLAFSGTISMFTGEIQNLILSCAYLLPIGAIYRRDRSQKGLLRGLVLGTLLCSVVAVFSNMFMIIPFYAKVYGFSIEQVIESTRAVNPLVNSVWKFVLLGILPFNIIKGGVTSTVAYMLQPALTRALEKEKSHAV